MAAESRSPSPPLLGYTTAGEEVDGDESGSGTSTLGDNNEPSGPSVAALPRARTGSFLRDSRGRFISQRVLTRSCGSSESIGSATDLTAAESLTWDAHSPQLDATTRVRLWSVGTLRSEDREDPGQPPLVVLPTHPEGRESAASGEASPNESLNRTQLPSNMEAVRDRREGAERALMQLEDDLLPFRGKRVPLECLVRLGDQAAALRGVLQECHMHLLAHDSEVYQANLQARVQDGRRALSAFIVENEEAKMGLQEAAAAAAAVAQPQIPHQPVNTDPARQGLVRSRVGKLAVEIGSLKDDSAKFLDARPAGDEALYENAEEHKVLSSRLEAALAECKVLAGQALEHGLIVEGETVDDQLADLREIKKRADEQMLLRRKRAGVWSEKGRRVAARGDMKAPVFSGAATDRLTVYEFEREWASYKGALNYSVDEALKELKVAVQAPARAAVAKMETEAAIFAYLRTHYGNPVLLLSAREEEIRAWTDCKGTDQVRREWLIHAKNRLESTISLCKDHKIEKYLHFSSVAGIVQSKLPYDMTRDFRKVLVKHLSPAGVLEKEIVLELLVAFIEEKILDCTLGVNLEVVNFLGADRPEEKKDAKQQSGGGGGQKQRGQARAHHQRGGGGGGSGGSGAKGNHASSNSASPRLCIFCGADHPFLFYCEDYIKAKVGDRFNMAKDQQSCVRCLTMGRKFSGPKKDWW
jgi:hypothetical protein